MNPEDSSLLFDADQISRRLDLILVKHLQVLLDAYSGERSDDPNVDAFQMNLVALKASVAELIAQNNRILWSTAQRHFVEESDSTDQT